MLHGAVARSGLAHEWLQGTHLSIDPLGHVDVSRRFLDAMTVRHNKASAT
jgi:hypothetical protein